MHKKIMLFSLILLILPLTTLAQEIDYYYGEECPYCQQMSEFLETEIIPAYPDLIINKYETWHDQINAQALTEIFDAYAIDPNNRGVPALIIGQELIIGNRQEQVAAAIEILVRTGNVQEEPIQEDKPVQAGAVTTYSAWVLVGLVVIGIFSLIIFKRKNEDSSSSQEQNKEE